MKQRNSIIGIFLILIAIILLVAAFGNSGHLGGMIYDAVHFLFGLGYYVLPALFILLGVNFFRAGGHNFTTPALVAGPFFLLSALGLLSLMDSANRIGRTRGLHRLLHHESDGSISSREHSRGSSSRQYLLPRYSFSLIHHFTSDLCFHSLNF